MASKGVDVAEVVLVDVSAEVLALQDTRPPADALTPDRATATRGERVLGVDAGDLVAVELVSFCVVFGTTSGTRTGFGGFGPFSKHQSSMRCSVSSRLMIADLILFNEREVDRFNLSAKVTFLPGF